MSELQQRGQDWAVSDVTESAAGDLGLGGDTSQRAPGLFNIENIPPNLWAHHLLVCEHQNLCLQTSALGTLFHLAPRPPAAPGSARRRGRARGSAGCSARPGRRRGRGPPGGASHRTAGTGLVLDGTAPEPPSTTHTIPPASGLTDSRGGFLFGRIEPLRGPQLSVSSSCGTRAGVTQGLLARAPGALGTSRIPGRGSGLVGTVVFFVS